MQSIKEDILKRLNCRGSAIIEYTIILAFIASVATSLVYSDGFKNSIVKTTNSIIALLGGNPNVLKDNSVGLVHAALIGDTPNQASKTYSDRVAVAGLGTVLGNDKLIELESNQDYEIVVDLNEFCKQTDLDPDKFELCLLVWDNADSKTKAGLDTGDMSATSDATYVTKNNANTQYQGQSVTATYDSTNNTVTYSFKTQQDAYMGMNLVYGRNKGGANDEQLKKISDTYQSYVTVQKASK